MEDTCGSPVFRGGVMGFYMYVIYDDINKIQKTKSGLDLTQ